MHYPGRVLCCLGLEVRALNLLTDSHIYMFLNTIISLVQTISQCPKPFSNLKSKYCEEPTGGPLLVWGKQGLKAMKGVVICKVGDENKEP